MKTKLLFITLLFITFISYSQNTAIPDPNFEQVLIDLGYDSGTIDGFVPTANINTITELIIPGKNISDLTGIEDFTALEDLYCFSNPLGSIDVSSNTQLELLHCQGCQLTNLDLSQNTALKNLHFQVNNLVSIDLSQNTELNELWCYENQLTNLDISQNTTLRELRCDSNELTNLDTNQNTTLLKLYSSHNQLTSLDMSLNIALTELWCNNNELTELDVRQNTALKTLHCSDNELTSLNAKNGNNTELTNFSSVNNPNLMCIEVDDATYATNNWTGIDPTTTFSEDCSILNIADYHTPKIAIYPNPTADNIIISLNEEANYILMGITGNIIQKGKLTHGENSVDLSHLTHGLYYVSIKTALESISKKVVKN